MTIRENIIEALEGRTPERTPLSIYDWNMQGAVSSEDLASRMSEDAWKTLIDQGLGITHHCEIVEAVEHDVKNVIEQEQRADGLYTIERKITPVGEVRKVSLGNWHVEEWIKEPEDYLVWKWIVEHTELVPRYDRFARAEEVVGDSGVVVLTGAGNWTHRTPAMRINVDLAGTEQFCMDVATEEPELIELYEALRKQFLEQQRLIARAPGRYVKWLENLTISMLGPQRYRDLLIPVYEEGVPILEAGEKRVMVHYDGALEVIADQIVAAPFHMIESLTEAPEGDVTYERARAIWPGKVLWGNLNIGLYALPPDELRAAVHDKLKRVGRQGFAFEISEDLPGNWQESIPVVLDALL